MDPPQLDLETLKNASLGLKGCVVVRAASTAFIEVDGRAVDDLDALIGAHISDGSGRAESQVIGLGGENKGWVLLLVTFHAPLKRQLVLPLRLTDDDEWLLIQQIAGIDTITFVFSALEEAMQAIEDGKYVRGLTFPAPIEAETTIAALADIREQLGA